MMPTRALGRRPHDPQRLVLKLSRYLTGAGPQFPPASDHLSRVVAWDDYRNGDYGVCGPAALAHQRSQITSYLTDRVHAPTQADVFAVYTSQNPDFDPRTGLGDHGVVLADLLSAVLRDGIGGVRPLAYAAVDADSYDEVHAAIALFGSVICGLELDVAQDEQFDAGQPWDYVRRSREWGGHAVLAGAYTGDTTQGATDISVITWGQRHGCTDEFFARQLAEAWVVIWPEALGSRQFAEGVDVAHLAADYEQLTGRPFPALTPRQMLGAEPYASPPPDEPFEDVLRDFIRTAQGWLDRRQG